MPLVLTVTPSGSTYDAPGQIETFLVLAVPVNTVKIVVIVLSQPCAFEICEIYVPLVLRDAPSGKI